MHETPHSPTEVAARLLANLRAADELTCTAAEEVLAALVEAEFAGEPVDQNPAFTPLLHHLDHCPNCLKLYEQLASDLDAVVGADETLAPIPATAPRFFAPSVAKGEHILLQMFHGVVRRFTLILDMPRLAPSVATLSGTQRSLFADRLPEVAGEPLLAISVGRDGQDLWIQVALRDPGQASVWHIELVYGDQTLSASTDPRGLVRFALPPELDLGELRLNCEAPPIS